MANLWKQIFYPTVVTSGSDYTTPLATVNSDGELVVLSELILNTTGVGPYSLTGFFVGYDFFGNQNITQQTVATASIPDASSLSAFNGSNSYSLVFPSGLNGDGVAFYVGNDGAGHWTVNNDTISSNDGVHFTQTTTVVDSSIPDTDKILGLFATARGGDPNAGQYGVGYAVLDPNTNAVEMWWQGYNADGSAASVAPVSIFGGSTVIDSDPAGQIHTGGGAFVAAVEEINGSSHHFIHFQSFNVDGTLNTNIGGGTGEFNLNGSNTDVDNITQLRFQQFSGSSPGNSASTFVVVDDEVKNEDSLNHVIFRFDHMGTVTTADLGSSATQQRVAVVVDRDTGISFVGWGDTGSSTAHGAHIAEFDSNGAQVGTTFDIDDGRFRGITSFDDGRVGVEFIKTIDAGTNTTQDVIDIVDFRSPGQTIDDSAVTGTNKNNIAGTIGNDIITGSDTIFDRIDGANGSDKFIFDSAAFANALGGLFDEVVDYDQGNSGHFSSSESDQVDVSAIVGASLTGGADVRSLVHVFDDGDKGTFLVVDSDGTASGTHYVPIAQLDGIHTGDTVNAIVDGALPAGVALGIESDQGYAGNFNSATDAISDLVTVNDATDAVRLFELNGNPGAGGQILANLAVGTLPTGFHVEGIGDFDGDGNSDLLLADGSNHTTFWEMNGATVAHTVAGPTVTSGWSVVGVGDFNGDGISDFAIESSTGSVRLWEMNGHASGSQLGANLLAGKLATDWHVVAVGDFNGDGIDDLMWRNDSTGTVKLWAFNGAASGNQLAVNAAVHALTTDWHVVGSGDFNHDGNADLLIQNDLGNLRLWELDGKTLIGNLGVGRKLAADEHVYGTGDFNGDGTDDILINNTSGSTNVWELNGNPSGSQILDIQHVANIAIGTSTQNHHFDMV